MLHCDAGRIIVAGMIKYSLRCADGHAFESWFASAAAYDALEEAGRLSCAVCGGGDVGKALMAPRVRTDPARGARPDAQPPDAPPRDVQPPGAPPADAADAPAARALSRPASAREAALTELRRRVEAGSEDVGRRFAAEARAIHAGEAPARAIRGEATGAEARALAEDGVPILPLPFAPTRKVN